MPRAEESNPQPNPNVNSKKKLRIPMPESAHGLREFKIDVPKPRGHTFRAYNPLAFNKQTVNDPDPKPPGHGEITRHTWMPTVVLPPTGDPGPGPGAGPNRGCDFFIHDREMPPSGQKIAWPLVRAQPPRVGPHPDLGSSYNPERSGPGFTVFSIQNKGKEREAAEAPYQGGRAVNENANPRVTLPKFFTSPLPVTTLPSIAVFDRGMGQMRVQSHLGQAFPQGVEASISSFNPYNFNATRQEGKSGLIGFTPINFNTTRQERIFRSSSITPINVVNSKQQPNESAPVSNNVTTNNIWQGRYNQGDVKQYWGQVGLEIRQKAIVEGLKEELEEGETKEPPSIPAPDRNRGRGSRGRGTAARATRESTTEVRTTRARTARGSTGTSDAGTTRGTTTRGTTSRARVTKRTTTRGKAAAPSNPPAPTNPPTPASSAAP